MPEEGYSAVKAARQLVIAREKEPIDWEAILRDMAKRGR